MAESVFSHLRNRETLLLNRNNNLSYARKAHTLVYPTKTLYNVQNCPQGTIRKFTPDGQYLICFTKQHHAVQLFRYHGPAPIHPETPGLQLNFSSFFTPMYEVTITSGYAQLSKDFCLFSVNKKFMILASACSSTDQMNESRRYPNSLRCITHVDDVTFWVIEIATGIICDQRTFKNDYIYLTNHAGVHLYKDLFGITSVQNQSIYILKIEETGKLVDVRTIGWYVHEDDEQYLERHADAEAKFIRQQSLSGIHIPPKSNRMDWTPGYSPTTGAQYPNRTVGNDDDSMQVVPTTDPRVRRVGTRAYEPHPAEIEMDPIPLSGLKQKIMTFLYRKAYLTGDPLVLQNFYTTYGHFLSLTMWRMQFLDEHHIIVKFGHLDNVIGRNPEPSAAQASFFVIYSLFHNQVIGVYENSSEELLQAFQKWDLFRGVPFNDPVNFVSSPCNNEFARDAIQRQMYGVRKARNGGGAAAVKRVLSTLPFNPQSYVDSPYFDHALFSYDEKVINSCDRQRPSIDFPIKFHGREHGDLKFKIDPNISLPNRDNNSRSKRYVSYVFHPNDPFVITVQMISGVAPAINIHFRDGL
ncbi:acid phosphatase det1 [Nowakowskiella sp. JEL0407]|nr:acid phosphatase det1 [Nowakowskiella sp. JEL0407]